MTDLKGKHDMHYDYDYDNDKKQDTKSVLQAILTIDLIEVQCIMVVLVVKFS